MCARDPNIRLDRDLFTRQHLPTVNCNEEEVYVCVCVCVCVCLCVCVCVCVFILRSTELMFMYFSEGHIFFQT